jgi:hypothetical protein
MVRDARALERFRREARAASALNHPNICTVYDIDDSGDRPFFAMELLEGRTLREMLRGKPLPLKKAVDYAIQIADALQAAHARGIVHRDIKPANVFVGANGHVKLLDFGLAKDTERSTGNSTASTVSSGASSMTTPGAAMGTIAYMSPEQASGEDLDARTDLFSFGVMLYEMAAGEPPFSGASSALLFDAILNRKPRPVSELRRDAPPELERLLAKMLEKDRTLRCQTASEVAGDLRRLKRDLESRPATVSGAIAAAPGKADRPATAPGRAKIWAAAAAVALAMAAVAFLAGRSSVDPAPPAFHRVTFRRGYIPSARFGNDQATIIYGAAWDGAPNQIYSTRLESPESRPLGLANANILSVSPKGEMALSMYGGVFGPMTSGMLARSPLGGGAPREVEEGVGWADWARDGEHLAVVREVGGKHRIEFPEGKTLYETTSAISQVRVAPDGSHIAFAEHPLPTDFSGSVAVIDLSGKKTVLSRDWGSVFGLAWRNSDEIWFTAYDRGDNPGLRAVTLGGRVRLVSRVAGWMTLHDVASDGRALLTRDNFLSGVMCRAPGQTRERDLYWLDYSIARDLSDDGSLLLFHEGGEAGGRDWTVYVRGTDGSPAVRLAEGYAMALSPDKKWAMVSPYGSPAQLVAVPTGAGQPRTLTHDSIHHLSARWLPDGKRVIFAGTAQGQGLRLYVQDDSEAAPRAITPEGIHISRGDAITVSPDGRRVAAIAPDDRLTLYNIEDGTAQPLAGIGAEYRPIQWSTDGRELFAVHGDELPAKVERIDVTTGRASNWMELMSPDAAGLLDIGPVLVTPDGKAYAYSYDRTLSDLYHVSGLR